MMFCYFVHGDNMKSYIFVNLYRFGSIESENDDYFLSSRRLSKWKTIYLRTKDERNHKARKYNVDKRPNA